ncbi:polysaccharide deacetylase family protein [Actinomadura sp. NTSP31]|uniref:polysaccharide deacetylase family protein n=1 Tax=Actinomadura sp. NTSP31 TaxID=1735447 RepID=UPI0035C23538
MGERAEPAPWERPPPGRSTRVFRAFTGLVFLCALVLAVTTWVTLSRPFDPGQKAALTVRLDPAAARTAAALPRYPGSVLVLTYHGVSDTDHAGSTLSRRMFGEHMAALAAAGYRTVRLRDVEDLIAHRSVRLPPRALLITFDDGQLTDWTTADPVLKAHGFTAAGFLTTGKIVQPGTPSYYLSTRQVRDLAATGRWEFGSHSDGLHDLTRIPGDVAAPMANRVLVDGGMETIGHWRARVRADLARSQRFFTGTLGRKATAFSYPFGEPGRSGNDPRIAAELPTLIRHAGFSEAFTGENVPTDHVDALTANAPRWGLDRIGVRATTSVSDLLEMVRGAVPTPLPHALAALPWTGDLAACRRHGSDLRVTSDVYGSCLLTGANTSQWTDYRVTATISGIDPRTSAVIAVRDGAGAGHRGRAEVVVGAASVLVRQQIGVADPVVLGRRPIAARAGARAVRIEVRGARLSVAVGGGAPLRTAIDPRLNEGGLTFEIAARDQRTLIFRRPALDPLRAR